MVEKYKYPKKIEIKKFIDSRGYFSEIYSDKILKQSGINENFIQDNLSFSEKKGTLRGMHLQIKSKAQSKLLKVMKGKIFDVCVDLRIRSKTFGTYFNYTLSSNKNEFLYIPKGFAHGFITLENKTEVIYKVDNLYSPKFERTLIWHDKEINIKWPKIIKLLRISEKDKKGRKLEYFKKIKL